MRPRAWRARWASDRGLSALNSESRTREAVPDTIECYDTPRRTPSCQYPRMTHFKVGDKVIITEGDFKGERGAITDKHLIGDGLTVALEKHGKEIKTHEAHVNKVND
jgi:transcription antitermination factor NusG